MCSLSRLRPPGYPRLDTPGGIPVELGPSCVARGVRSRLQGARAGRPHPRLALHRSAHLRRRDGADLPPRLGLRRPRQRDPARRATSSRGTIGTRARHHGARQGRRRRRPRQPLHAPRHDGVPGRARASARTFACPYHGWTYDLSGALLGVPYPGGYAALRQERARARRAPPRVVELPRLRLRQPQRRPASRSPSTWARPRG